MNNAEEYNVEVDEDDNIIGMKPKSYFHEGKGIHRAVVLYLFNSKGEMLLQKRAMTKKWFPGLWTYSVAGTVADEECDECIVKETKEEIGLDLKPEFMFKYSYFGELDKAFFYAYKAESDQPITPETREMDETRWVSIEFLKEDIEKNSKIYTPPFIVGMKKYLDEFYKPDNKAPL